MRPGIRRIDEWFTTKLGRRLGTRFYYGWLNSGFKREQRAVLAGREAFERSRDSIGSTNSLLRRNIHRLEKGLIMRPRRDVFALDYLVETLDKFETLAKSEPSSIGDEQEYLWFTNVLRSYFEATSDHPVIESQRKRFGRLEKFLTRDQLGEDKVPFAQARRTVSGIEYKSYRTLCEQRKSVRWFQQRPVPRTLIRDVLDVARFSPSACNRYPFRFLVFDEPDKVAKVAKLPGGTVGFAENFPVIIAIVGELRNYYGERDRHLIYVDAALAAMSAVLAAETLGLASCCINWPDIEEAEKEAEQVLGLEPDQRPVMFLALGYPDPEGLVAYSQKKSFDEVIEFNRLMLD